MSRNFFIGSRSVIVGVLSIVGVFSSRVSAMEFTSKKLYIWRHVETIAGEEFTAANETVVDYIAGLARPTEPFHANVFQCQVKYRETQPSIVINNGGGTNLSGYINMNAVYDIQDCAKIGDYVAKN